MRQSMNWLKVDSGDNYANIDQPLWHSSTVCLGTVHCPGTYP